MTEIVVIGHGGYAFGVKTNLEMITGIPNNFHFLDFEMNQQRDDLEKNLDELIEKIGDSEILFCCDLPGATPFQIAAIRTASRPKSYCTIAGINSMAYMEMALDSNKDVHELALQAVETTKESVLVFTGE